MKSGKLHLAIWAMVLAGSLSASASIVVNFDTLATPINDGGQHWGTVPSVYAGLNWVNWEVANGSDYKTVYGNTYLPPSLPNFGYNRDGIKLITTSAGFVFDFLGASVSTWAQNNSFQSFSSRSITVKGYKNGVLMGTVSMNLLSTAYSTLNANLVGVDKLEFYNDGTPGRWWILDNFEYQDLRPIPEPTTMIAGALLLLPFGASTIRILRKRHAA